VHLAARNGVQQSIREHDDNEFILALRSHAKEAFDQRIAESGSAFSKPFYEGFLEGFIDYVEAGGTGEPPYLPPFRYRLSEHRTTEGHAAIQDWYAGFRQGAAAARASGLRELNCVPLPGPAVPGDFRGGSTESLQLGIQAIQPFATDEDTSPRRPNEVLPTPAGPTLGPTPRIVPGPPEIPSVHQSSPQPTSPVANPIDASNGSLTVGSTTRSIQTIPVQPAGAEIRSEWRPVGR
jgi:hypothetical protein